jgi:cytochrome c oxidase subunit 2
MTRGAAYATATAPALVVLGFFVWFANWIPQTRWEPPKARQIGATMAPAELGKLGGAIARERGCMACHTIEPGVGVKGLGRGPNLWNLAVRRAKGVPGGPDKLVDYLVQALYEPGKHLVDGFSNIMPPYGAVLSDLDIAGIINFLRKNFAPGALEVTPAQVAARRALP